jgi:hypothetical protein
LRFENKLTDEFVKEHFKDVHMTFTHYYKYMFTFTGYKERFLVSGKDYKIIAQYGGNHDDIYRFSVDINKPEKFRSLESYSYIEIFEYDDVNPPTFWTKVYEYIGW